MKKMFTCLALASGALSAQAVTYTFAPEFSNSGYSCTASAGCATLDVTSTATGVHMKLQGTMVGSEFITGFYGNNTGGALSPNNFSGTGLNAAESFNIGSDSFKADGDGYFDWLLNLSSNPPRFDGMDVLEWDFLGSTLSQIIDGLSVNGPAGKTGFSFALHAQGLGEDGGSGWFYAVRQPPNEGPPPGVPEPGTLALAGLSLLGTGLYTRRKNKV